MASPSCPASCGGSSPVLMWITHASLVITNPAGTTSAPRSLVISHMFAPFPPSRSRISREPSAKSYTYFGADSSSAGAGLVLVAAVLCTSEACQPAAGAPSVDSLTAAVLSTLVGDRRQIVSGTISIAPHGHSATQMPQPLQ